MSAFSANTFNSHDYSLYRPSYSTEFFQYIFQYLGLNEWKSESINILDVGSGPGTCILKIIPILKEVINSKETPLKKVKIFVSDLSNTMLNEAKINIDKVIRDSLESFEIEYIQSGGETIDLKINEQIDLIIAAECVHWLNSEKWLDCMHKLLKKDGVLAYWGYVDPVFTKIEGSDDKNRLKIANDEYNSFVYEEKGKLGEYWQQPGRSKLRSLYKEVNEIALNNEGDKWYETIMCRRDPLIGEIETIFNNDGNSDGDNGKVSRFEFKDDVLKIEMRLTIEQLLNYMDTWSSSFKWNSSHEEKVSLLFGKKLEEKVGLKKSDDIVIEMKTVYLFTKKV